MTVVAGVDVGNSTTEVVLVESEGRRSTPLVWDSAPTRGVKGSTDSLRGAAVLVRRLERRSGRRVEVVAMAPLRAVLTQVASTTVAPPSTGRLVVLPPGGSTPGGLGTAVGAPCSWDDPAPDGPVVLLVRRGVGYGAVARRVSEWLAAGVDVRGVVLADDEAVLVSRRLPRALPVLDLIDVDRILACSVVAMEVVAPGHRLQDLADPIRLSALLNLERGERADAVAVAGLLGDASQGVVAISRETPAAQPDLSENAGAGGSEALVDQWSVALRDVADSVLARVDARSARAVVSAGLLAAGHSSDPERLVAEMGELVDAEVRVASSEAGAARVGALTTPGADPAATIVDLGGGTIDVIRPPQNGNGNGTTDATEAVVAGAGELLTVAVATLLAIPRGAADWVKRGPAARLEAPQVLLAEDGTRAFLDAPAAGSTVGSLVAPGPAGLLPFGAGLAPSEWRALRLRTKERVIVQNLLRALALGGETAGDLLLVGGVASDEELVGLLRPVLSGAAVGRANVAGVLGHRYAVAYGLATL